MTQPLHSTILHEIVRIIDSRSKVPERVQVRGKEYQLTYLEDHKQRLEESIRRHDGDRLNMLYGQLASKVKYQALRAARATARRNKTTQRTTGARSAKTGTTAGKKSPAATGRTRTRKAGTKPPAGRTRQASARSKTAGAATRSASLRRHK